MKVVILAGGYGTRISEESQVRPKPMVEIGQRPILWHIMKIYSHYGLNDFVICLGYKGNVIKEFFANYFLDRSDVTFDLENNQMKVHRNVAEPWRVTLVNTGMNTMTGGRLRRIRSHLGDEPFCLTYGDGLADLNIGELVQFHRQNNSAVTLTAVQTPGRFGAFTLASNQSTITNFHEKPKGDGAWINGGFFVVEPAALDYIEGDQTVWEFEPLQMLAREGKLAAFRHFGFWQSMDSLRDKIVLEKHWESGKPPWRVWDEVDE